MSERGGIGFSPDPEAEVATGLPSAEAASEGAAAGVPAAILKEMLDETMVMKASVEWLVTSAKEFPAALAQIRGQAENLERVILPQHVTAIQHLQAGMAQLAQQVSRNSRYMALELAAKTRIVAEPASKVVENAQRYLAFLEPQQVSGEDEADEAPINGTPVAITSH